MLTFDEIVIELRKHFKVVSFAGNSDVGTRTRPHKWVHQCDWESLLELAQTNEHLVLERYGGFLACYVYSTIEGQFTAVCKKVSKRGYHLSVVTHEHLVAVGASFEQLFVTEDFVDDFRSEATRLYIGYTFDATGVWIGWRDQTLTDPLVTELRKNFVVELRSTPLEHAASWNLQLDNLASRINVFYGQTCTHLELYKNGNYVDIVGHAKDFDRILAKMRAVHKVVDVCPDSSLTAHVELKDWVKIPATEHLIVCYKDGRLYYNLGPTYKTVTLSCIHLTYATPRFCGDRLPWCSCVLPRSETIVWTQRASDHKIIGVGFALSKGQALVTCMKCGASADSLTFMRNPLALIDKNKPESGVYCMPCYRQQLLAMFPE